MNESIPTPPLNAVWLKAATVGSVWAALEIVLGSFLHNLRVPLSGTLLAACGVALLTASQMIWREPGLLWRAGLICAIMKSVSPSAVILGPMIGILTEALVMQGSVLLLGRNRVALLIGGTLALLEPAIHRVVSLLIEYGLNAGLLYVRLYEFAARTLRIESVGPLDLVLAYFALNMLIGTAAVCAGLIVARKTLAVQLVERRADTDMTAIGLPAIGAGVVFHPALLAVHFAVMIGGLLLISRLALWQSALCVGVYVAAGLWRYPTVRRVFHRPKLWLQWLGVGIVASLLLGNLTAGAPGWSWQGLNAGAGMAVRAILVTAAFAAIGTELRNPRLVDWFLRRRWGTLSAALHLAFEALPTLLAALNEERQLLRHPLQSIARVLATGMQWLEQRGESPAPLSSRAPAESK